MDAKSVNLECEVGVYPSRTVGLTVPLASADTGSVSCSVGIASRSVAEHTEFCHPGTRRSAIGYSNLPPPVVSGRVQRRPQLLASGNVAGKVMPSTRPESRNLPARRLIRASAIFARSENHTRLHRRFSGLVLFLAVNIQIVVDRIVYTTETVSILL